MIQLRARGISTCGGGGWAQQRTDMQIARYLDAAAVLQPFLLIHIVPWARAGEATCYNSSKKTK